MSKHWIFPSAIQASQVEFFARHLGILPVTASILLQRGLTDLDSARGFLHPAGIRFRDFRELPGAVSAGEILAKAVRDRDPIVIVGDYDVDGITASALLEEFIRARGGLCRVHLPLRSGDGYGLQEKLVRAAAREGARLLITVDCGITAAAEVELAKFLGMRVIVTDHHEAGEETPSADALVNPKLGESEGFHFLSGVGVALQVARAASDALGEKDPEILRRHLDLVALGTVADVVPLLGENRSLTRAGLAMINRGGRLGLRALREVAGLSEGALSSADLAFRLAPRLNAAGRLNDARISLELLLSQDAGQAGNLARELNLQNQQRQDLEKAILEEAEGKLAGLSVLPRVLVVSGREWPVGVLGLVASRLCEKHHRPCFALSEQAGVAKGSGRSIPGFSLHHALSRIAGNLIKWGGHERAAGVTLALEELPGFARAMQEMGEADLTPEQLQASLRIDAALEPSDLDARLVQELKKLEPCGEGNPRPVFSFLGVRLSEPPRVLKERHLKLRVRRDGAGPSGPLEAIGFGFGHRAGEFAGKADWDLAGYVSENTWNGHTAVQVEIKDFREASQR